MKEIPRKIYDKLSLYSLVFCANFNISPNQITILNHFLTLTFGCYFFSRGKYIYGLLGLGVMVVNGFLDYLDGDLAKTTNQFSKLGIWLDSGFDIIIQNAVMGAIAIGCYKQGLSLFWITLFFIGNSASNFVSFYYNEKFGFDSDKGNELFRSLMDRKCHFVNRILKNIIDPTSNYLSLIFYTYRYWVALGMILGIMPLLFQILTVINNFKWFVMFTVYAFYLHGEDRLFVMKVLSSLDDEKEDFYRLRSSKSV